MEGIFVSLISIQAMAFSIKKKCKRQFNGDFRGLLFFVFFSRGVYSFRASLNMWEVGMLDMCAFHSSSTLVRH